MPKDGEDLSLSSVFDEEVSPSEEQSEVEPAEDSSESKEEEKKVEEDKVDESKSDEKSSSPDEKKEEEKTEEDGSETPSDDKKSEEKKEEISKKESEENLLAKRLKDTQSWANQEHQAKLQLQNQLQTLSNEVAVLKKKADGTWTEEDEQANAVTPESIATASLNVGKTLASRNAAYQIHGQEKVDAELAEFNELFSNNPLVQGVVVGSESPIIEALKIMDKYRFEGKYGADPKAVYDNIEKEVKAKYEKDLRKQITQEILEGKKKKDESPDGLSSSRGSNGMDNKDSKDKSSGPVPLGNLFG